MVLMPGTALSTVRSLQTRYCMCVRESLALCSKAIENVQNAIIAFHSNLQAHLALKQSWLKRRKIVFSTLVTASLSSAEMLAMEGLSTLTCQGTFLECDTLVGACVPVYVCV